MDGEETVVPAAGPADLVAAIWFRLGYKPRDSLVIVGLEGARQRLGLLLRSDLPPPGAVSTGRLALLVHDAMATVAASGAREALALVASAWALDLPEPPVAAALREAEVATGPGLPEVLGVTPTAFGSLRCRSAGCCAPLPIAEVMTSRCALAHIVRGDAVAESEAEMFSHLLPPGGEWQETGGSGGPPGIAGVAGAHLSRYERRFWWRRWCLACLLSGARREIAVGGLAAAMFDPLLRDAVLMDVLGADRKANAAGLEAAVVRVPEVATAPGWVSEVPPAEVWDLLCRRPAEGGGHPGRGVLEASVRSAAPGERAPALALLAFLAWLEGRGGHARVLNDRARQDCPSVSLSRLVEDLLERRVVPPWHGSSSAPGGREGRS